MKTTRYIIYFFLTAIALGLGWLGVNYLVVVVRYWNLRPEVVQINFLGSPTKLTFGEFRGLAIGLTVISLAMLGSTALLLVQNRKQ